MSYWAPTLFLLIGLVAASFVSLSAPWVLWAVGAWLCVQIIIAACLFVLRRSSIDIRPYLYVTIVMAGFCMMTIARIKSGTPEDSPWHYHYKPPRQPSAAVLWLEHRLEQSQLSDDHRAQVTAMLLGDRSHLSPGQNEMFRRAGAQHLLALSGTHLGLIIALMTYFFLWRARFTRWRWYALSAALAILWGYVFMVGVPSSLVRAALMATFFLLYRFSMSYVFMSDIFGMTIFYMLVINPLCITEASTLLSVSAVAGIVFGCPLLGSLIPFVPGRELQTWHWAGRTTYRLARWLWTGINVAIMAWIMTMPLVIYYFHQLQPWQMLTSVVVVLLVTCVLYSAMLLMVLCALGCTWLSVYVAKAVDALMSVNDALLLWCGRLPCAVVHMQRISPWQVVLLYAIIMALWVMWKYRTRRIIIAASGAIVVMTVMLGIL